MTASGSPLRRVFVGFVALSAASVITQLVGFAALAVAARRLGPDALGAYSFAQALALYFAVPLDFGITILGIRDIARSPERVRQITGEVLLLQLLIAVVVFLALLALAPVLTPTAASRTLLPIAGATVLVQLVLTLHWTLKGLQQLVPVAVAQLVGTVVFGVAVLVLVGEGLAGATTYAWLHVAGAVVTAAVTFAATWRRIGLPDLRSARSALRGRLVASLPLGVSLAAIQVYYSADLLMLGYLDEASTVGEYAVAYKLPLAVIGFASLWVAAMYPYASELALRDRDALRRQVGTFTTLALAVALPIAVGAALVADDLMPLLFGARYADAAVPFALLSIAAAIVLVNVNFGNVLLAGGDERRYALGVVLAAALNVGLNLAAIPLAGAVGAALATIAAELFVLGFMIHRFAQLFGRVQLDRARLLAAAGMTAAMALVLVAMSDVLPVLARLALAVAVFVGGAAATGVVRRDELAALRGRTA